MAKKLAHRYLKELQEALASHPAAPNLQVVQATDAEGNGFGEVVYSPAVGVLGPDGFTALEKLPPGTTPNAVCIN